MRRAINCEIKERKEMRITDLGYSEGGEQVVWKRACEETVNKCVCDEQKKKRERKKK